MSTTKKSTDPFAIHQAAIGKMLAQGVLNGRWRIEDFDKPTPGWTSNEADRRTAIANATRRGHNAPFLPPATHRNLAREWIEANPKEWDQMLVSGLDAEPAPLTIDVDFTVQSMDAA